MKLFILLLSFNAMASLKTIEKLKEINIDYMESRLSKVNAIEDKDQALYQYFPTINLFASSFESDNSFNSFGTETITSEGISARWTIFNFFQDTYLYQAQKNNLLALKAFEKAMKLAAEKSAFDVYLNYLASLEQYQIKEEITQTLNQSAKVAKNSFYRGEVSGSESGKIRIQALNTSNEAQNFKADSLFYEERIKELTEQKSLSKLWPMKSDKIKLSIPQVLARHLKTKNNPILNKLKHEKNSAIDSVRANKLKHLGNVDLNYQNRKSSLDDFQDWDTQITLTYTLPLFVNNSINSDVVKANNNLKLVETKLAQEKAKLRALKRSLRTKLQITFENYKRNSEASTLSNKIYKQELKKFKRGVISVNDLLFEQQRQSQSQLGLVLSKRTLLLTLIDYCHLQGIEFKNCVK